MEEAKEEKKNIGFKCWKVGRCFSSTAQQSSQYTNFEAVPFQ